MAKDINAIKKCALDEHRSPWREQVAVGVPAWARGGQVESLISAKSALVQSLVTRLCSSQLPQARSKCSGRPGWLLLSAAWHSFLVSHPFCASSEAL
jgi:hypothetical protein